MDPVERLLSWGTIGAVYASDGAAVAEGGDVVAHGPVDIIPGLGREVLALHDAHVEVTGTPDFTGDRTFTLTTIIRATEDSIFRLIAGRRTGGTEITLGLNPGGQATTTLSSTQGGYSRTLNGTRRLTDAAWHSVSVRGLSRIFGGIEIALIVDGEEQATAQVSPGLFGRNPDYSLTGPLVVGRQSDTSAPLDGEVAIAAWFDEGWTTESLGWLNDDLGAGSAGFTGWGIPIR